MWPLILTKLDNRNTDIFVLASDSCGSIAAFSVPLMHLVESKKLAEVICLRDFSAEIDEPKSKFPAEIDREKGKGRTVRSRRSFRGTGRGCSPSTSLW